ncbi:hypothetical protein KKB43_02745 [Patescibacteria group bacterium]|nr:hypothetical protein [Patescibacteria group bacterium]
MKNKGNERNRWLLVCTAILLLAIVPISSVAAGSYTVHGTIVNSSDLGEIGISAILVYTNVNNTSVQMTTTTANDGKYSFTVNNYLPNTTYNIRGIKGNYSSPIVSKTFGPETSYNMADMVISLLPVRARITTPTPIINKGSPLLINIDMEVNGNAFAGIAYWLSYNPKYGQVTNMTEGNIIARNYGAYFLNSSTGTDLDGTKIFAAVNLLHRDGKIKTRDNIWLGYNLSSGILLMALINVSTPWISTNGTLASYNLTTLNNGTMNITMNYSNAVPNSFQLVSGRPAWIRTELYTLSVKITQPCDINGDYVCNIKDLAILNSFMNKTGPNVCPVYYGRCNIDSIINATTGNMTVDINDKNILMANYGKIVNTTLPS